MKKSIIQLNNVNKTYKTKHVITKALDNISLEIYDGEFILMTGSSGCGKSTLLSIIGLLNNINSGTYILADNDVSTFTPTQLAQIRCKHIGFIFQAFNLIPELNIHENVALPLMFLGIKKNERIKKAINILNILGLGKRTKHFPNQLSGGQQQRVAIARALINKPDILLADEPTGNLDSETGNQIMEIFSDLNKQGQTIIMVTHDLKHKFFSSRNIELKDGTIR